MIDSAVVPSGLGGNSKHAMVARALMRDIASGKYPVGSRLPAEPDFAIALGVSRQTLRAALRHLREMGLVAGSQGVGSFVKAAAPSMQYSYAFDSLHDLLQYAKGTVVQKLSRREFKLTAAQASWLGRKEGEIWLEVHTVRLSPDTGEPIASSTILLPYIYGHILEGPADSREPIFSLIEKCTGEPIMEIVQNISVAFADESHAAAMGIAVGEAVLCFERRYFGRMATLLRFLARSTHLTSFSTVCESGLTQVQSTPERFSHGDGHLERSQVDTALPKFLGQFLGIEADSDDCASLSVDGVALICGRQRGL